MLWVSLLNDRQTLSTQLRLVPGSTVPSSALGTCLFSGDLAPCSCTSLSISNRRRLSALTFSLLSIMPSMNNLLVYSFCVHTVFQEIILRMLEQAFEDELRIVLLHSKAGILLRNVFTA